MLNLPNVKEIGKKVLFFNDSLEILLLDSVDNVWYAFLAGAKLNSISMPKLIKSGKAFLASTDFNNSVLCLKK